MNRITKLSESPCSKCGCDYQCDMKIKKSPSIEVIKDKMFGRKDLDYHDCGIWIALNAPEMVEVDDED